MNKIDEKIVDTIAEAACNAHFQIEAALLTMAEAIKAVAINGENDIDDLSKHLNEWGRQISIMKDTADSIKELHNIAEQGETNE